VTNGEASKTMFGVAALLEAQGANPYRVRAYRRAARSLLRLAEPSGPSEARIDLPWLGPRLRRKLDELTKSPPA
jgi:DNA polymerase (family 10)